VSVVDMTTGNGVAILRGSLCGFELRELCWGVFEAGRNFGRRF
jgi:hypothetical protein